MPAECDPRLLRAGTHVGHVDHAGLAGGAGVVAGVQQLLEAGPVQQVPAVRDVARDPGRVDVLEAHRAVGPGHIFDTLQLRMVDYFEVSVKTRNSMWCICPFVTHVCGENDVYLQWKSTLIQTNSAPALIAAIRMRLILLFL